MPHLELWQWSIGALCAFFAGVAKTGLPGAAIMVVPLMILTVGDARRSAAWLLPLLCIADTFAVTYWRRHARVGRLFAMAPWVLVGMAGAALALTLNEKVLRPVVGCIVLAMMAAFLYRKYHQSKDVTPHPALYGATAGFATTVANAAGPVMSLYLLSMRLPKEEFIATGAWFFFCVNLTKVPIYAWHGQFSRESLCFDLILIPAVVAGAVGGRKIVPHIPDKLFEGLIVVLTAASTLLLFR